MFAIIPGHQGVHLNKSYSYGIDDQDFVVAFDSDYPQAPIDAIFAQLANID